MKKTITAIVLVSLMVMTSFVAAANNENPFNKGWEAQKDRTVSKLCLWERPATEFREAREFVGMTNARTGECVPFGKSLCKRNPFHVKCFI